jgi:hypothetical protein
MSGGILGSAEDADVQNEVHSRQMVPPPIHVLSGMEGLTIREPRLPPLVTGQTSGTETRAQMLCL